MRNIKSFQSIPGKTASLIHDPKIQILSSKPLSLLLIFFPFSMIHWLFAKMGIHIWVPSSVKRLLECSVLFDIGGITFAERGLILVYNVLTLWPAMLLGVPVMKFSQAVGPFCSPINRFFARLFSPDVRKFIPAGEISAEYLAA